MKKLSKLALAAALSLLPSLAFAQAFSQYPTVGVPDQTQCLSFGNNGVCNQYRPAGPTAVTGDETLPADTNLTGGQNPQTVRMPIVSLGGGLLDIEAPLTGATLTVTPETRQLIVNPAGTIATLTVNLPAASSTFPYNGQRVGICGTQVVTALTLGGGTGNTFNPTQPTAMLVPVVTGAASCFEFIYSKTSATAGVWFRTQ
jgi:hypothetical protein